MTDVDWAGDVKDRGRCCGIAVWVERSTEDTGYPVVRLFQETDRVFFRSPRPQMPATL